LIEKNLVGSELKASRLMEISELDQRFRTFAMLKDVADGDKVVQSL